MSDPHLIIVRESTSESQALAVEAVSSVIEEHSE
jgi:hypothetical protein